MSRPLSERPGYREGSGADELQRDLDELRKTRADRCRARRVRARPRRRAVIGETDQSRKAMDTLARRILTDIDDGRHEPLEHMSPERVLAMKAMLIIAPPLKLSVATTPPSTSRTLSRRRACRNPVRWCSPQTAGEHQCGPSSNSRVRTSSTLACRLTPCIVPLLHMDVILAAK
jgi:hypothetical protein